MHQQEAVGKRVMVSGHPHPRRGGGVLRGI
jgi:hypothetical protein